MISKCRKRNLFPDASSPISNGNLSSPIKKQIADANTLLIADLFYFKEST